MRTFMIAKDLLLQGGCCSLRDHGKRRGANPDPRVRTLVGAPRRARVPRESQAPHRRSTRPPERPGHRVAVTLYKLLQGRCVIDTGFHGRGESDSSRVWRERWMLLMV